MKIRYPIILFITLLLAANLKAQLSEDFHDGDFTTNPVWTGNITSWNVNTSLQLQSNNTIANSSFYLSTQNTLSLGAQWEFYVKLGFNPSSANYVDIFLTASNADLIASTTTGYFIRIGNTDDEISLYRKDAGSSIKIIDGINGILNTSSNTLKIKVTRDAAGKSALFRDITGAGNNYSSEGTVADITFTSSSFFGILIKQSTAGFFQLHFFDNIEIKPYVPDVIPPQIISAVATDVHSLDILFNEPLDLNSSQFINNYSVDNGIGMPVSVTRDAVNNSLLHLQFNTNFPNGINCTVTVKNIADISGNAISNGVTVFVFYTAQQYDVVIDEVMADPSPPVALPEYEFIELVNTSSFPLNLQGWKLADLNGSSGSMASFILKPGSFVIICSSPALALLSNFGDAIAVTSFPSLDNDGEIIYLKSADGTIIHAVQYSSAWYGNEIKKAGGWSLEMIDTKNPCTESNNWIASTGAGGGTPGNKNSVNAVNIDNTAPQLKNAFISGSQVIHLVFDEPIDSLSGTILSNYKINGIAITEAIPLSPLFNEVEIKLNGPLSAGVIYTIMVDNVTDCKGNIIGADNKALVGLPDDAAAGDVVINEILFNPQSNGYDYVELYNKSNKIIDASKVFIATRSSSGDVSSAVLLSALPVYIFPGDYIALTENAESLHLNYLVKNPAKVLVISSMPSFADDKGDVIITNVQGGIVDEVKYDKDWHFKLIDNPEGVSLERIDPNGTSQEAANWHSAASTAGYGTPTYINSQFKQTQTADAAIEISPKVFSPDNDGRDDIATIQYKISEPGYVANITIFDAAGRPVRVLVNNGTMALSGYWNWDGLNDKGLKLPIGTYVIYTEIFNLQGKKKRFKHAVVLARKLN